MNRYGRYSDQIQLDIERKKLERLFDQPKAFRDRKVGLRLRFKQIGLFLLQVLTSGNEPRVWVNQSSTGNRWRAYDPMTNRSASFDSEEGLRVWLEQRYYL